MSWFQSSDGFELFSNRDERRDRREELVACEHERGGVRWLAPLDGEAGGSWITVNEYGVALCLLNLYEASGSIDPSEARSRGLLVQDLADCAHLAELHRRTAVRELGSYRPFRLLGLEVGRPAELIDWDGRARRGVAATAPLVSSSVDLAGARRTREQLYTELADAADPRAAHLAFHGSHADGPGPRSVCMHRTDAETRSLTHVAVGAGAITLRHGAGSPCCTPLGEGLRLAHRVSLPAGS